MGLKLYFPIAKYFNHNSDGAFLNVKFFKEKQQFVKIHHRMANLC